MGLLSVAYMATRLAAAETPAASLCHARDSSAAGAPQTQRSGGDMANTAGGSGCHRS